MCQWLLICGSVWAQSVEESGLTQDLRIEELDWSSLRSRLSGGEYEGVERTVFEELSRAAAAAGAVGESEIPERPWIRRAEYEAEFRGDMLSGGRLRFFLYDAAESWSSSSPPTLGLTNLRRLLLFDPQGELPLGADLERQLYVLKRGVSGDVSGTWEADGVVSGESVAFRLEFPTSTTARLRLTTAADIQVSATESLVSRQASGDGRTVWTLIPSESSRLSFVCRRAVGLAAQSPALLTGFGAWHALQGDILTSRWTLGVPAELTSGSQMTLRLSPGMRVLSVSMEDQRTLRWEIAAEPGVQLLTVTLPAEGAIGSFSVQCVSVIEQPDAWHLPSLVPSQWQAGEELRGPLLTPSGPVTVTLPASLRVDEWGLTGMQERDVIAGPDLSQTFQLMQFLPEAAAFLRTSANSAQLSETVVHLAESTGQTETVRSYVNLECAEASVVEIERPIAAGWEVISVRYASSGRPLLFESRKAAEGAVDGLLRIYLPETLEAGSSRVLEIHFQEADGPVPGVLQLPLPAVAEISRREIYLLLDRGGSAGLAGRWSSGRGELALPEFRLRIPWFPEQRIREGLRCYLPGSGAVGAGVDTEEISESQPAAGSIPAVEAARGVGERLVDSGKELVESGRVTLRHSRQFHLLRQPGGRRLQEILAWLELDCGGDVEWISARWSLPELPLIVVNGRGVRGELSGGRLRIPLPSGGGRCRVFLLWRVTGTAADGPEWKLRLGGLQITDAVGDVFAGRTVHAVLGVDDLQVAGAEESARVSGLEFSSGGWPGAAGILDEASEAGLDKPWSAGLRQFVARWEFALSEGFEQRLYVDEGTSTSGIRLRAIQRQRSTAAAAGAGLVCFGFFLGMAGWLSRRLPWASVPVGICSAATVFTDESLWGMVVRGCFWGGSAGMVLVMLLHSGQRIAVRFRRRLGIWSAGVLLMVLNSGVIACAQQVQQPLEGERSSGNGVEGGVAAELTEVLIPRGAGSDGGLVFVRNDLLQQLRQAAGTGKVSDETAEGLIERVRTRVLAESKDRVELILDIDVSIRSGTEEAFLYLPIAGTRLVSCSLDGTPILPETVAGEQLLVRLPPSIEVAAQNLSAGPVSADGDVGSAPLSALADDRAAYTKHRLECRLWPVLSRQSSVVQFRLPGLPSPRSTIEITSPAGLYKAARLQTEDGVFQWDPAEGGKELNSLSMRGGADLRLLQVGMESAVPVQASVEGLVIAENSTGLQQLTLICRFRDWNPLNGELRFRIPGGYRLISVTSADGVESDNILWSLRDQQAVIALPPGNAGAFVLQLELAGMRPLPVLRQQIPAAELTQFADCLRGQRILAAVRSGSALAVTAPVREQAEAVAFSAEAETWGQWLRRTDSLLRIPVTNPLLEVKLEARMSRHEVRMSQSCTIRDQELSWSCRMDVETSQLPVFRHRISIPAELQVTEVQLTSGEANRLQSWHRRGDQLTVQLREGTTGLHGIELRGRVELRPDDGRIRLLSPRLGNAQILESTFTLQDETTVGLQVVDAGAAVPLQAGGLEGILKRGEAFRLQITNESRPLVLERLNPVEPTGQAAVIRSRDSLFFVMRLSNWSSRLGPLRMEFGEGKDLISDPIVLTDQGAVSLTRNAGIFESGQEQLEKLFGVSEFSVVWQVSGAGSDTSTTTQRYSWPRVSDRIQWGDVFYGQLRGGAMRAFESQGVSEAMPAWAISAAESAGWRPEDGQERGAIRIPMAQILTGDFFELPAEEITAVAGTGETGNGLSAFSASSVLMQQGRPGLGRTAMVILASQYPRQAELEVPAGLVLTDLPAALRPLPGGGDGTRYILDLTGPVTQLALQWVNVSKGPSLLSPEVRLKLPQAVGGANEGVLLLTTADGERLTGIQGLRVLQGRGNAAEFLGIRLRKALEETRLSGATLGMREAPNESATWISKELLLPGTGDAVAQAGSTAWFAASGSGEVEFVVRQRLDLQKIMTGGIGLLICAAAFLFAASGRSTEQRSSKSATTQMADGAMRSAGFGAAPAEELAAASQPQSS